MLNKMKKIAAAMCLTAIVATPALAQKPKVMIDANTPAKGATADVHFANDSRVTMTADKWSLIAEANKETMGDGSNYLAGGWNTAHGNVSSTYGFRITQPDKGRNVYEANAFFSKELNKENRLNVLLVGDSSRFALAQAGYVGKNIDATVTQKVFDWSTGGYGTAISGGIHDKEGNAGVWYGRSDNGSQSVTTTVNMPGLGAHAFAKYNPNTSNSFGIMQLAAGGSERYNGAFTKEVGNFIQQILADQNVHPYYGNEGSYLANGGKIGAEVAYSGAPGAHYVQAQAGGAVLSKGGTTLALGAGMLHHSHKGNKVIGEAHYSFRHGEKTIGFTLRATPALVGSLSLNF